MILPMNYFFIGISIGSTGIGVVLVLNIKNKCYAMLNYHRRIRLAINRISYEIKRFFKTKDVKKSFYLSCLSTRIDRIQTRTDCVTQTKMKNPLKDYPGLVSKHTM